MTKEVGRNGEGQRGKAHQLKPLDFLHFTGIII